MFAKMLGRRATAIATTLAVVVGLAITPAFAASAADGDVPLAVEQTTEAVIETELPPVEQPVADGAPPVEELSDEPLADEPDAVGGIVDSPTPQSQLRASIPMMESLVTGPAVITTLLPDAILGVAYSQTLEATQGSNPNHFEIAGGDLPPGLSLHKPSGTISGTVRSIPANPTTYNFSVTVASKGVTSEPKALSISVGYPAPVVTTTTVPDATVGVAYPGAQLTASGTGTITWSATGLPAGLTLNAVTGAISGTPSYDASYEASKTLSFTVTAGNGRDSAPKALSITVLTPLPVFGSTLLPDATVGVMYDQTLPVTNGYGTLSYQLVGTSALPSGLVLGADGRITGTPAYDPAAGASKLVSVKIRVQGTAGIDTRDFTFSLLTPAPIIVTDVLAAGWLTQQYTQTVTTTGPGVSVTIRGLPNNLRFDGTSITGKSRSAGDFRIKITAVNAAGEDVQWVTLTINDKPELSPAGSAKVETGTLYRFRPQLAGTSVTLSLGADAPDGMTLNQNGVIKWTPTASGTYRYTVQATNLAGTDTQRYAVKVFDAPVITQGDLERGITNMPYRQVLQHDSTKVTFAIVAGELPNGLTLTKKGVIKGVATEAGTFSFKVRAENAVGVDRQWFTLTVMQPTATLSSASVIRGDAVTVSGTGFLPGDSLELWLHSTPVLLGTVLATDGTFTTTVVIPAGTEAGLHHVEVRGAQSGSQFTPLTVSNPAAVPASSMPGTSGVPLVTVIETPMTPDASAEVVESAPATSTLATGTSATSTPESATSELPTLNEPKGEASSNAPSQDWTGLVVGAFALLLAALLVGFLLWRRRRQTEEG